MSKTHFSSCSFTHIISWEELMSCSVWTHWGGDTHICSSKTLKDWDYFHYSWLTVTYLWCYSLESFPGRIIQVYRKGVLWICYEKQKNRKHILIWNTSYVDKRESNTSTRFILSRELASVSYCQNINQFLNKNLWMLRISYDIG